MAMTLDHSPSAAYVHGVFEPILFTVSSTEQSGGTFYKFRYIAELYVADTDSPYTYVKKARIKLLPNSEGVGIFQVNRMIEDFMEITSGNPNISSADIHTLGSAQTTKIWANNEGENYRKIKINFGQEYATTEDGGATEYLDLLTDNYVSCIMSAGMAMENNQFYHTWDMGQTFSQPGNDYINNFTPNSSTDLFLSDRIVTTKYTSTLASDVSVVQQNVSNFEWRTLATLMDDTQPVYSDAVSFYVALFDSSGSQLDANWFTAGSDGGTAPADSDQDFERLQFIGVGPRNLTAQIIDTGFATHFNNGDVAHYEVFLMDDSATVPSNATTANMSSCCYRFDVVDPDCVYHSLNGSNRYNYVTLAWQNSLGAWDYQAFGLKHQRSTSNIERKTFDQVAGNWDSSSAFKYRGSQGGMQVNEVNARQMMTANTTLFDEDEVQFLENLFLSPKVHLLNYDGSAIPILITDKNWIRKNDLNEGGAFLYQIKFEYAKQRPTVR